jgi:hypothetical protein
VPFVARLGAYSRVGRNVAISEVYSVVGIGSLAVLTTAASRSFHEAGECQGFSSIFSLFDQRSSASSLAIPDSGDPLLLVFMKGTLSP